ncbi:hypothetical protein DMX11_15030 [Pseudomonas sp. LB-090624]|uniref:hypothetical protein n=1 Tax=Pseudomonas sp. LB-090624 TaxID=2213079 RepID=UPI000D8595B7|nr:hypothetical protein [Pseudomonas sp. LB-090624]PYB74525.1 hypothetical protein DMX11_15030 [Pseudomonas sp. LB-090624]
MRIRGQIGDWPVDLTIELAPEEWAQLGREVPKQEVTAEATPMITGAPGQEDGQWARARELLRQAGHLRGPQLLEQLEALVGSVGAGKRLLVRLRHSPDVRVESAGDAPVYHWVGPGKAN